MRTWLPMDRPCSISGEAPSVTSAGAKAAPTFSMPDPRTSSTSATGGNRASDALCQKCKLQGRYIAFGRVRRAPPADGPIRIMGPIVVREEERLFAQEDSGHDFFAGKRQELTASSPATLLASLVSITF